MSGSNPLIGLSYTQTRKVFEALAFAAEKHRNQRRKDIAASPYINHPIALANVLVNEGGITDYAVLCAAILHDTIEDTQTTHGEIVAAFGHEIADLVAEVTDDKTLDKQARKQVQIEKAVYASPGAALIKIADKICNLRDLADAPPHDWPVARCIAYFEWAARVVTRLNCNNHALVLAFERAHAACPAQS